MSVGDCRLRYIKMQLDIVRPKEHRETEDMDKHIHSVSLSISSEPHCQDQF